MVLFSLFSDQAKEMQANFLHLSLLSQCVSFLLHLLFEVMTLVSAASSIDLLFKIFPSPLSTPHVSVLSWFYCFILYARRMRPGCNLIQLLPEALVLVEIMQISLVLFVYFSSHDVCADVLSVHIEINAFGGSSGEH